MSVPSRASMAPSQMAVTTTSAAVGGIVREETQSLETSRQVLIGSIAPNTEWYIWPGHPDAQYIDVFPMEMTLIQTDSDLRLDPEEGWRLLYSFMEPGVRRLQVNTPVNLARIAKSDSIVEMIQIHAYLKDVPDLGRRDYRQYPPRYGDPQCIYKPHVNGDNRERDRDNRVRECMNL